MKNKKPLFISFEGGEGSGKSTQAKLLSDYFNRNAQPCILTREIGGTTFAENARNLIMNSDLDKTAELLLIMSARADHIAKLIVPKLSAGNIVICDRYIDSSAAYQSKSKFNNSHFTIDNIYEMHSQILPNPLIPDITFFLAAAPEIALERARSTSDVNRFDNMDIEIHQEIFQKFINIQEKFSDRIILVETFNKSVEQISLEICQYIDEYAP